MTRAYFLGDSFTAGGYALPMGARFGWAATIDGVGGTGYVNPAAGTKYGDRLAALVAAAPDVVIIEGGGNDVGYTDVGTFTTAVQAFFTSLRASLPNVPLYVTGGHRITQSFFNALVAAAATAGATFVDWGDVVEVPRTTVPPNRRWFTGTGNTGAPAGDGNRDTMLGPDNVHPSVPAGYAFVAAQFCYALPRPTASRSATGARGAAGVRSAAGTRQAFI